MSGMKKIDQILLEYFKEPFDEQDAADIIGSDDPVRSCTKVDIIWGLFKCTELLEPYHAGCTKTLTDILKGIEPEPTIAEIPSELGIAGYTDGPLPEEDLL